MWNKIKNNGESIVLAFALAICGWLLLLLAAWATMEFAREILGQGCVCG